MRELTCDLFLTIDGFAAGDDVGPFFGYAGPEVDAWVHSNLERPQVDAGVAIAELKQEQGEPLRTIGSISLVRSLLALDLVDRLRLVVFPLTLGDTGRERALSDYPRTSFELAGSSVLDGRLVALDYGPRRS